MIVLIWVVLAAFGLALFIICGALVEMYRTIDQIRVQSGVLDSRTKLHATVDIAALQSAGLPAEIFQADRAVLLILSDRCSTCELLAERLAGGPPPGVLIVVQPYSAKSAAVWLGAHALNESPSVLVDTEEEIVDLLGIRISPAVLRLRNGQMVAAHTVPSPRRLTEELRWVNKGGQDEPEYEQAHESFRAAATLASRQVDLMLETTGESREEIGEANA